MAQRNGVLDTSYLTPLIPRATVADGNVLLVQPAGGLIGAKGEQWASPGAAAALFATAVLFRRRLGRSVYVLEAFRSMATQEEYRRRADAGTGNFAAWPGTSIHGWGDAFDLASGIDSWTSEAHRVFAEEGAPYGLHFPLNGRNGQPNEPWHCQFDPLRQQKRPDELVGLQPADGGAVIINEEEFTVAQYEDIMAKLNGIAGEIGTVKEAVARIDGRTATQATEQGTVKQAVARIDTRTVDIDTVKQAAARLEVGVTDLVTNVKPAVGRVDERTSRIVTNLGA